MKTSVLWEQYQHYTADATDYSRKLAFATAAICWFFKSPKVTFPTLVSLALVSTILFFAFDLLQSLVAALVLRRVTRLLEEQMWAKDQTIDGEVHKPNWVDYPAFTLFLLKVAALFAAFSFLIVEFYRRLDTP